MYIYNSCGQAVRWDAYVLFLRFASMIYVFDICQCYVYNTDVYVLFVYVFDICQCYVYNTR